MQVLKNRFNLVLGGMAILGFCAGAAAKEATKEAAKETPKVAASFDKAAHLDAHFSSKSLIPEVKAHIEKDAPLDLKFKTIEMKSTVQIDDGKEKKEGPGIASTFANAGDGFIKEVHEYANKDAAFGAQFATSYGGLIKLRSQTVRYSDPTATNIIEAKQIVSFAKDLGKAKSGQAYQFEMRAAPMPVTDVFNEVKVICRAGKSFAASTIHEKIQGNAIELDCENSYNGKSTSKTKFALLQQYGLALTLENHTGPIKQTFKVTAFDGS